MPPPSRASSPAARSSRNSTPHDSPGVPPPPSISPGIRSWSAPSIATLCSRALAPVDSEGRRRRIRRLGRGALVVLVVGSVAGAGYHFYREQGQRTLERETVRREDERQARPPEFIATFVSAAPRPDWWESVETPYRVDNLGDLLAAWQGFPRGDDGRG